MAMSLLYSPGNLLQDINVAGNSFWRANWLWLAATAGNRSIHHLRIVDHRGTDGAEFDPVLRVPMCPRLVVSHRKKSGLMNEDERGNIGCIKIISPNANERSGFKKMGI